MKRLRLVRLISTAFLAALLMISNASAQTNLLDNPGFELNGGSYDLWFTFGDGVQLSTPAGDDIARTDSTAAKIYGEFTGCPDSPSFTVGGFGQSFTPTPGLLYQFSGWSFISNEDQLPGTNTCLSNRAIAKVVFFNATVGGAEISSNEVIIGDGNSVPDQWNEFTVEAPCPAGALRVEALILFLQPACDTGSVYIDDTAFYETTPETPDTNLIVNPSFDDLLNGWNVFANVFTDTRSFAVRTISRSAKLFGPFANPGDASGMYQAITGISEGTDLDFSAYSMTTCVESPINGDNDNYGSLKLVYKDSGGNEISSDEVIIIDNTSPLGTWVKHSVTGTVPAGTDTVEAYILFIQPTSSDGAYWVDDVSLTEVTSTGIGDDEIPSVSTLFQNYPNPFNPTTQIDFNLAEGMNVEINIYDVAGRHISTLVKGYRDSGLHTVRWDGKTDSGKAVASGVYYYSLKAGDEVKTKKMVLLR